MRGLFFIIFFVLSSTLLRSQDLISLYNSEVRLDKLEIEKLIISNDSWSNYKLAQYIDTFNNMYRYSNDPKYLMQALSILERVASNARISKNLKRSQFRDDFYGWENLSHSQFGDDGKEYSLHDSFLWRYGTNTLFLAKNQGSVSLRKIHYLVTFVERNVYEKWLHRGKWNVYRNTANLFAQWAHIGMNLWLITRDLKYKNLYEEFNRQFYSSNFYSTGKPWRLFFQLNGENQSWQDVSHANSEISYFISYDEYISTRKGVAINPFIKLLAANIIKPNGTVTYYLDGSGPIIGDNRWMIDGFLKLGRYGNSAEQLVSRIPILQKSTTYFRVSHAVSVLLLNKKFNYED
ncbi:hypothetical protein ACX3PU_03375 [Chryseobacterium sp. A301]